MTYKFYVGRLAVFDEDYVRGPVEGRSRLPKREQACSTLLMSLTSAPAPQKEAQDALEYALRRCHVSAARNRARILKYLLPVRMLLGVLPSPALMHKYQLEQYQPIAQAVRHGDLQLFDDTMELQQLRFIREVRRARGKRKRRAGRLACSLCSLQWRPIRDASLPASAGHLPPARKASTGGVPPPPARRARRSRARRARQGGADSAGLVPGGAGCASATKKGRPGKWCGAVPTFPASALSRVLSSTWHFAPQGVEMDMDEIECVCANLIYRKYIKGYISHKNKVMVVAKSDPFPPLSSVTLRDA